MGRLASAQGTSSSARVSLVARARPLVVARLLSAFVTFSIPLVLARAMQLEEYGAYKQLFLVAQTLYHVLTFGVAQSLYYFVPRAPDQRAYRSQALTFLVAIGCVGGGALLLFGGSIGALFSNPALAELKAPLAVYVLGLLVSYPLEITLTSRGRTGWAAIAYLGSDVVRTVAMIAPALLGFGLSGVVDAIAVFSALRAVVSIGVVVWGGEGPLFSGRLFVQQLLYAAPFGAAVVLNITQQYAHHYAVAAAFTPTLFAIYAVGCFQLPLVDLLYTPLNEVLMVRLGELDRSHEPASAVELFRTTTAKLGYAFVPLAGLLFTCAPEFIAALFGDKFLSAVPIFRIAVLGLALAVFPVDGVLRGSGRTGRILLSHFIKASLTLGLLALLMRPWGLIGAITAAALGEVIGVTVLLLSVPAALAGPVGRVRLGELVPWRELGHALLATGIAGAAVAGARIYLAALWFGHAPGFIARALPLAAAGLTFVLIYGALVLTPWVATRVRLQAAPRPRSVEEPT